MLGVVGAGGEKPPATRLCSRFSLIFSILSLRLLIHDSLISSSDCAFCRSISIGFRNCCSPSSEAVSKKCHQGQVLNYHILIFQDLTLYFEIIKIYNTPINAEKIEAIIIDDFAICRFSGCVSKPSVAINVDIVKPIPAISEAPITC